MEGLVKGLVSKGELDQSINKLRGDLEENMKGSVKTVTHGIKYKFAILKSPKIDTLWENCHHFLLAYQNLRNPSDLEGGDPRLPKLSFSKLEGHKFQSYISWKVGQ